METHTRSKKIYLAKKTFDILLTFVYYYHYLMNIYLHIKVLRG